MELHLIFLELSSQKLLLFRFAGPESDEDDRGGAFENMKIQIRAGMLYIKNLHMH